MKMHITILKNNERSESNGDIDKTKGHSLGGGPSEETGSRLDLESIVIDPAPVNNPGKYIDDGRTLVLIPNHGKAMLNKK